MTQRKPRRSDRSHTIASIHHEKADKFWNIWAKGAIIGGTYILSRIAMYRFKQSGARMIRRYELIQIAMRNATQKKWGGQGIASIFPNMAVGVIAQFASVDPAYGTLFDEWQNEYNRLMSEEKIRR